jgi:hypothetical protein
METIETLAQAALERDHLRLRSLVQDLTRANTDFSLVVRPQSQNLLLLAMSASLAVMKAGVAGLAGGAPAGSAPAGSGRPDNSTASSKMQNSLVFMRISSSFMIGVA